MAAGVRGMRLKDDDFIVGAQVITTDESILTVTEKGYGKRSPIEEYRLQKRGGRGVYAIKPSERNGDIIGAMQVYDNDEVILIADSGKMIRMDLSTIRIIGRTTQGVRLINIEEHEKVVAMDTVAFVENDDEDEGIDDGTDEE
jgi:DNA gyrase subunit A